jgi:hypothetical protein
MLTPMTNKHRRRAKECNQESSLPPFRVQPHHFGFKSGIDLNKMNQLVDELEVDEVAKKLARDAS